MSSSPIDIPSRDSGRTDSQIRRSVRRGASNWTKVSASAPGGSRARRDARTAPAPSEFDRARELQRVPLKGRAIGEFLEDSDAHVELLIGKARVQAQSDGVDRV